MGNISLKRKLTFFIVGVSLFVVTVVTLISLVVEYQFYRDRIEEGHRMTAKMMAGDLEVSLDLGTLDRWRAEEVLSVLKENDTVVGGAVLDREGRVIGGYPADDYSADWDRENRQSTGLFSRWMEVRYPIKVNGSLQGEIVLRADDDELGRFLLERVMISVGLLCLGLVVAFFLASKLSSFVFNPILKLASTTRLIAKEQNYSLREEVTFSDEVGELVVAFNQMMEQIEHRNGVIKANEERFRRYFDLGVVGMAVLDADFKWIESNDRLSEIVGYDEACLRTLTFFDILDDESVSSRRRELKRLKQRPNGAFFEEFWLRGADGKRVYASVSLRGVSLTETENFQYILLLQDVTDRRQGEQELLDAKERAEASSKAKDEFLSIMSHELRTPLNPIIGFGAIVKSELNNPELEDFMEIIVNSGQNLLDIIEAILEYTRIERGDFTVSEDEFDYVEACKSIVDSVLMTSPIKELDLRINHVVVDGSLTRKVNQSRVMTDKTKFRQVLLNLVSNAVKFTDSGRVRVDTVLRRTGGDEEWELMVKVSDTGIGIDDSDRDNVFRAFSQIDSSLTRRFEGIGLGLATSEKIVKLIGGEIDFSSRLGEGSEFWFCWKVKPLDFEGLSEDLLPPIEERSNEASDGHPVLLVEDDASNRFLATTLLNRHDLEVVCAGNGIEAVNLAQKTQFSLILMDLQMPKMNGLQATMRIRESEGLNIKTPIIAITAHASTISKSDCLEVGMDDYLSKPFDSLDFEQMLGRWLSISKV